MAFPQVGLQVILDIKQFQNQQTKLEQMLSDLTKSFPKVGAVMQKAFVEPKTLQAVDKAMIGVQEATRLAAEANKNYADISQTVWRTEAEKKAALEAVTATQENQKRVVDELATAQKASAAELAGNMTLIAGVVGMAAAAFGFLVTLVKSTTNAFMEQIIALEELKDILGMTSTETAVLAKMARDLGMSEEVVTRGAFAFYRQLESLKQAEFEGQKVTNNFSRELEHLGISTKDAAGNWRPFNDVLLEAFYKIQALPSQYDRVGAASQLLGRQNAALVVMFSETYRSADEVRKVLENIGLVAGPQATEAARTLQYTGSDLKDAWNKVSATFGEAVAPALIELYKALVPVALAFRDITAAIRSTGVYLYAYDLAMKAGMTRMEANQIAMNAYREQFEELTKGITAAEKAQQEQAIIEGNAATAAEEAADRRKTAMQKEQDALKELQEAREKAFDSYQKGLADLARSEQRAAIERNLRAGWEVEDTLRKRLEREQDLERDYNRRLEDIRLEQGRKQQDDTKQRQRKLEDLERAHQLRLIQIQLDYQDAVEEALRSNDAVAILAAMRTRKRAIRDEELKQKEQRDTIRIEGERTREDQLKDLEQRRQDALRDYQNRLADMQLAIQREDEEKVRQNDRDKILRALQHKWALEDLKRQYQEELAEAEKAYLKQREEYAQFLTDMGNQSASGVIAISNQIANAINTGSRTVLLAEEQWLKRHFYLLSEAVHSSIGLSAEEQWRQRHSYLRAEGGVDVVNRPTNFVAGEAGPEIAAFIPLRHTMSINHSFGNLGVSMNGQSMNMNQGQMENVFWALMMQLPDLLSGRR